MSDGFTLHFDNIDLDFHVRDTPIAIRWFDEIAHSVKNSQFIERDRLYNFIDDSEEIMDELIHCAELINTWKPLIDLSSHDHNHLHKYFEIMRGSIENASHHWNSAPLFVRKQIERFNILIHKMESYDDGWKRIVIRSDPRPRKDLHPEDYSYFTPDLTYGTAYINYCHVGKLPYDVWKDGDEVVGEENIVPQTKYSSDMVIYFSDSRYDVEGFNKWWKGGPTPVGKIPVADLYTELSRDEIIQMISKNRVYNTVSVWYNRIVQ